MVELSPETAKDIIVSKNAEKNKYPKLFYQFEKETLRLFPSLTFGFLHKLSFLSGFWDSHHSKAVATLLYQETNALTEFIMKKFREICIYDSLELPLSAPPRKRRRLLPSNSLESKTIEITTTSEDTVTSDKSKINHKRSLRGLTNYMSKQKNSSVNSKLLRCLKIKSKVRQENNILPPLEVFSPLKSADTLSLLFRGCVNFVRASKFSTPDDIDLLLKRIVRNRKVISIQDHWSETDCTRRSHWTGALVAYRQPEDSQKILKDFFLNRDHRLLAVDVPRHLWLIANIEARLTTDSSGTCIFIEGLSHKTSRKRISHELDTYGNVLLCSWRSKEKEMSCEVTYQFSVEAVAAALALDGKCVGKNVIKTGIKMEKKERDLHMMVCGHYC